MTSPFLGEIRAFGFQFAPSGWQACNGQLLPINQYQALFALLGTTYGGNGIQTFGLPDLRGRIAMGVSPTYTQGASLGAEGVALVAGNLPVHKHNVNAANNGTANGSNTPGPTVILGSAFTGQGGNPPVTLYAGGNPNMALLPLTPNGSNQPHENRMPSLVMNYCIAMSGLFPSRP